MKISTSGRYDYKEIREKANYDRKRYCANDSIPVPIDKVIEFRLRIKLLPKHNLKTFFDIDACLSHDLTTLWVDNEIYFKENYLNRCRFTFAHELGHYTLHRAIFKKLKFSSEAEWLQFQSDHRDHDYDAREREANEYAGRFLVPVNRLCEVVDSVSEKIEEAFSLAIPTSSIKPIIARAVCEKFGVHWKTIEIRLEREKLWDKILNQYR